MFSKGAQKVHTGYCRGVGKGTVFRKNNGWAFRVDAGIEGATGKRRQMLRQGFGTKRQAETALTEMVHASDNGGLVARSTLRLGTFLDDWVESQSQRLRPTTLHSYRIATGHVDKVLGRATLQSLNALQIEKFYAEMGVSGGSKGTGLAAKTVRNIHVVIRKALSDAERLGLVQRNVASAARPPVAVRPEFATWSSSEVREFFDTAKIDRLFAAFVLSATTGMRRGEVLGMRWNDVDFDAAQLAVVQTITTAANKVIVSPPKTPRSRRTIYLDAQTLKVLREHRRKQSEERLAAGPTWVGSNTLLFTNEVGELVRPDLLTRTFTRLSRTAGLPIIRLHDLRHTYATLALKAGVHPKVVSERLGHATVAITLDLYSHVTPAIARDAADVVAAKIFGD